MDTWQSNYMTLRYQVRSPKGNLMTFVFRYQYVGSTWRAYIVSSPSYAWRSSSLHCTHRLTDSNGYYICWNQNIQRLDDITTVSKMWAEATAKYIDYGTRF